MKRKILFVITELQLGGAQKLLLHLLRNFDRRRFSLGLITRDKGYMLPEAQGIDDLPLYLIPQLTRGINPFKDALALWKVYRIFKEERPFIVHTHTPKAGIIGRFAARLARVPKIVHTIHGLGFEGDHRTLTVRLFIYVERWAGRVSAKLIAVSSALRNTCLRLGLFPGDRCVVIHGGINLGEFSHSMDRARAKALLGVEPSNAVVGTVACFKPGKGLLDFVEMAFRVWKTFPHVEFVVAGDGDLRPEVQTLLQKYGLSDTVHLLGWRRDVPAIMAALDVFMLTSLHEGLGLVYLEAMASGVPIVCTDVDGAREVIRNGQTGFIVPKRDVEALAQKVVYLLRNRGIAVQMGKRGRDAVRSFDIDQMVQKYEELYNSL